MIIKKLDIIFRGTLLGLCIAYLLPQKFFYQNFFPIYLITAGIIGILQWYYNEEETLFFRRTCLALGIFSIVGSISYMMIRPIFFA